MEICKNFSEKSLQKFLFALLLASFIAFPSFTLAEDKIQGKYEVIGPVEKLKGVKQVEMAEFFNYSCGHCYRFLETSKKLHAKLGSEKAFHVQVKYNYYKGALIAKKVIDIEIQSLNSRFFEFHIKSSNSFSLSHKLFSLV